MKCYLVCWCHFLPEKNLHYRLIHDFDVCGLQSVENKNVLVFGHIIITLEITSTFAILMKCLKYNSRQYRIDPFTHFWGTAGERVDSTWLKRIYIFFNVAFCFKYLVFWAFLDVTELVLQLYGNVSFHALLMSSLLPRNSRLRKAYLYFVKYPSCIISF